MDTITKNKTDIGLRHDLVKVERVMELIVEDGIYPALNAQVSFVMQCDHPESQLVDGFRGDVKCVDGYVTEHEYEDAPGEYYTDVIGEWSGDHTESCTLALDLPFGGSGVSIHTLAKFLAKLCPEQVNQVACECIQSGDVKEAWTEAISELIYREIDTEAGCTSSAVIQCNITYTHIYG